MVLISFGHKKMAPGGLGFQSCWLPTSSIPNSCCVVTQWLVAVSTLPYILPPNTASGSHLDYQLYVPKLLQIPVPEEEKFALLLAWLPKKISWHTASGPVEIWSRSIRAQIMPAQWSQSRALQKQFLIPKFWCRRMMQLNDFRRREKYRPS